MAEAQWFVVHTYSGYENNVKTSIEKTVENRKLQDLILDVRVPLQDTLELKNGERVLKKKMMFPGYVLVHMVMNDNTWYVVRNTRGVTGFVGPGSKPVPLKEEEIVSLGLLESNTEVIPEFVEGEEVIIQSGGWRNSVGEIKAVNNSKRKVMVEVTMFNRATIAEFSFDEVIIKK
ncbi:MAG: transcription termination/antitermination factor NusG [Lachnospiraceae bacterium]|jgi:transcriptional antiterminator NusG|nr:transcription termination/antitermination factor NusG [Lachnospiraceae bacterium]